MGKAEFSTSLAQFNQEQLDSIQAATDEIQISVDAIKNTDIAALNDKVGTAADAAAVLTLFGKLQKVIGDTSGLGGKIGENTEGAGTATIFQRLQQIEDVSRSADSWASGANSNAWAAYDVARKLSFSTPGVATTTVNGAVNGTWYVLVDVWGSGALYYAASLVSIGANNVAISIDNKADILINSANGDNAIGRYKNPDTMGALAVWGGQVNFNTRFIVKMCHYGAVDPQTLSGVVNYALT